MLIIRSAQMLSLEEIGLQTFRDRAALHVREQLPEIHEARGDAAIRELADLAVRKGRAYGLESEVEHLRLLNVMLLVDPQLDADPATPWAREILGETDLSPETRLDRLVERAAAHLEAQGADDDA